MQCIIKPHIKFLKDVWVFYGLIKCSIECIGLGAGGDLVMVSQLFLESLSELYNDIYVNMLVCFCIEQHTYIVQ